MNCFNHLQSSIYRIAQEKLVLKKDKLEVQKFFLILDVDDSGTLDRNELLTGLT